MAKDWYEGCTASRHWRLNHLYHILTKDKGVTRFRMNKQQEHLLKNLWNRNLILKARQLGMSTFMAILMLDCCLFQKDFQAGVIDKTLEDAKGKLDKIRLAVDLMRDPEELAHDHVEDAEDRRQIALYTQAMIQAVNPRIDALQGRFDNGSKISVGTSLRGGTFQMLHISEFGHIAANYPGKAAEILSGGVNAVSSKGVIVMESTHEGGKYGEHYRLLTTAMDNVGKKLSALEDRFFFFPWYEQEEYRLPVNREIPLKLREYFSMLAEKGVHLDAEQKTWYAVQSAKFGHLVKREFPTTPEEAFEQQVEGAIYGRQLMALRSQGKLAADLEVDAYAPLYVSWDIGMSDYTAMWLWQVVAGRYHALDYYCANDFPIAHYIDVVHRWERDYKQVISRHLLPHDAARRDWEGTSFSDRLTAAGFCSTIIPRTRDVWAGIHALRDLLPHCVFDRRCAEPVVADGTEYMAGLDALQNYQKKPNTQTSKDEPLHDQCSHGADAARYFAEACAAGLVSKYERDQAPRRRVRRTRGVPEEWD